MVSLVVKDAEFLCLDIDLFEDAPRRLDYKTSRPRPKAPPPVTSKPSPCQFCRFQVYLISQLHHSTVILCFQVKFVFFFFFIVFPHYSLRPYIFYVYLLGLCYTSIISTRLAPHGILKKITQIDFTQQKTVIEIRKTFFLLFQSPFAYLQM